MYSRLLILFFLLLSLTQPPSAMAHSVYIFAWPDGAQVCSESYFTRKNKVKGGEVVVRDGSGRLIASGPTDQAGNFCFPYPASPVDLDFTVMAGPGHQANFRLGLADLPAALPPSSPIDPGPGQPGNTVVNDSTAKQPASPGDAGITGASNNLATEELRQIVREELQNQLGPIQHSLAGLRQDRTPGLREIIGGIGWLAGLGALGYWLARRWRGL